MTKHHLTPGQIQEILASPEPLYILAQKFGVSNATIRRHRKKANIKPMNLGASDAMTKYWANMTLEQRRKQGRANAEKRQKTRRRRRLVKFLRRLFA